ncbi:leucine-rich repeat domain-containing protein [Paenibacillus sp. M1]|uniref:Leucine-rich repeat domain-containing protein n=1 Tax=Paenibacillus haidiansis TaxID=1574488 RepID=A0ABU7VYB4_9BACL
MSKRIRIQLSLMITFMFSLVSINPAFAENSLIPDKNLEQAIRIELNKPTGTITEQDLASLTSLYPEDSEKKVVSLTGLEYAVNMESLMLPGLGITSIEPLKNLRKVTFLALNGNQISEMEPLQEMKQLKQLIIDANNIEKLDALSGLTNLTDLLIGHNRIKDLSPIQTLTKLNWLIINDNQIQSLEPLRNHPNLEYLYIENNQIQDISVLTSLPKLKEVSLSNNPLDANAKEILAELSAKGVEIVDFEEEAQPVPSTHPDKITAMPTNKISDYYFLPFLRNGSVLVPFIVILESLGMNN